MSDHDDTKPRCAGGDPHLGFVIQSYGRRRTRGAKEEKPPGRTDVAWRLFEREKDWK